jgi:hypothetical protein
MGSLGESDLPDLSGGCFSSLMLVTVGQKNIKVLLRTPPQLLLRTPPQLLLRTPPQLLLRTPPQLLLRTRSQWAIILTKNYHMPP